MKENMILQKERFNDSCIMDVYWTIQHLLLISEDLMPADFI